MTDAPSPQYSSGTDRLRRILGAFYKTVDVMKSSRNSKTNMNIWADDMKAVEDVMLFLEELRDADGVAQAAPDPSLQKMQISTRNAVIEECARVADRWDDGEATMAAAEIRMLKTSTVPSTPTDRNLAESRCEDCPAPRCFVCPVTSTPRGGEA